MLVAVSKRDGPRGGAILDGQAVCWRVALLTRSLLRRSQPAGFSFRLSWLRGLSAGLRPPYAGQILLPVLNFAFQPTDPVRTNLYRSGEPSCPNVPPKRCAAFAAGAKLDLFERKYVHLVFSDLLNVNARSCTHLTSTSVRENHQENRRIADGNF